MIVDLYNNIEVSLAHLPCNKDALGIVTGRPLEARYGWFYRSS